MKQNIYFWTVQFFLRNPSEMKLRKGGSFFDEKNTNSIPWQFKAMFHICVHLAGGGVTGGGMNICPSFGISFRKAQAGPNLWEGNTGARDLQWPHHDA